MNIESIIDAIRKDRLRITDHAIDEAWNDALSFDEIFHSVFFGKIIEEYHDDRPFPSCLVSGESFGDITIHTVWAYNKLNKYAVLITAYRPDDNLWNGNKRRSRK
jgi:hypothetical protein